MTIEQSQLHKLLEVTKYACDDKDITAINIEVDERERERKAIDKAILSELGIL